MTIKRILTVLISLAAALLTVCAVTVIAAGSDLFPTKRYGDYLCYEYSDSISIDEYVGKETNVVVPSVINGKKVTGIHPWAFENCTTIKSITLPDGVEDLSFNAFEGCSNLTSVTLPDSITDIPSETFLNCTDLKTINIPDGVTEIGKDAFKGTALLNDLTSTVKYAGKWVIGCDKSASTATIKSGTVGIAYGAFEDCSSLTSVNIPDNLKYMGEYAFANCSSLASVKIPTALKTIESCAFKNCSKLTSVNIPNGVIFIEDGAFSGCSKLTTVTVPDSIAYIKPYAFSNTPFLTKQTSTVKYAGNWVIGCDKYATSVTLKSGTIGIAESVFADLTSLTTVIVPDSLKYICWYAFKSSSIQLIILPDSLKNVGFGAFNKCLRLTDVCYLGSAAQWEKVNVDKTDGYNNYLLNAQIQCLDIGVSGLNVKGRSGDAIRLGWNRNPSADGYILERKDGNRWVRVAKISKNSTTEYRISGLKAGTTYNFRIKSYFMSSMGALYSSYISVSAKTNSTPTAVSGLKLKGRSGDALRIGWTKNTGADGYIIEMKSGSSWVRVGKITNNSTVEFRKAGLKAGTAYTFRVKSYRMSGKTAYYSGYKSISARTDPSVVSGLKLKNANSTAVRLSWTKNTSADGYIIEMKSGTKWVRVGKITKNSTVEFRKGSLKSKTSYTFRIKTYKMSGSTALYGAAKTITVKTK